MSVITEEHRQSLRDYFVELQHTIVSAFENAGTAPFRRDDWERAEGGGGISRLIENDDLLERAGVLFSDVRGTELPPSATERRPQLAGKPWEAMGVSLVVHPRNPHIPTVHMNVRAFVAGDIFWFGGGMDLTPYYPHEEDARHFHQVCADALAPHGSEWYPKYKAWCDDYFYIRHRNETRGVGGIFFDDHDHGGFDASFQLTRSVGDAFLPAYLPILERRRDIPWGERERDFQAYRRGRYVEFNLVYDRGTLFGLQSKGRTESILMSMPPHAAWRYDWQPEPGTAEAKLAEFLVPRQWV